MKESELQKKIKARINQSGGIDSLVKGIEILIPLTSGAEQAAFKTMRDYFSDMFKTYIPVEDHAEPFEEASLQAIVYLEKWVKSHHCKVCMLLIDVIMIKLDYLSEQREAGVISLHKRRTS